MSLMQIRFSDEACDGEDQMYQAAMASSSQTIQEEEKQKKTLEDIEWWIEKAEKTTNKVIYTRRLGDSRETTSGNYVYWLSD